MTRLPAIRLRRGLRHALLCLSALTLPALAALPAQAAEITLKISHYLPDKHGIHTDFLEPWARELEAKTNGKVAVEILPGPSAFGNVAKQMDQVKAGVVDMANGLAGMPRGRLPRTSVMDMPFLAKTADAATRTLWDLHKEGLLADEYKGVKPLALYCHNAGLIHTTDKPVRSPDDLKGLRLRTPSPAISEAVTALGGTPVGLPPAEVYESLQKKVLDGTIFTWDAVGAFRLNEVLKYHTDARTYTTCFFFVMNEKKYESLPADVRAALDSISGDALIPKFGPWWDKWDARGMDDAKAKGHEIITLTDAERQAFADRLQALADDWIAKLAKDDNVPNAAALYDRAKALVAKYEQR